MEEDPNKVQLLTYIKDCPGRDSEKWVAALETHRAEKAEDPEAGAANAARWQRTHAQIAGDYLSKEQYDEAMGHVSNSPKLTIILGPIKRGPLT